MIKKSYLIMIIIILLVTIISLLISEGQEESFSSPYRALPRPIAEVPILISSAGQNTDAYILKDIANELMLDYYFIPMADKSQLSKVNAVVMVIGYSETTLNSKSLSVESEKQRIKELLGELTKQNLVLISIYMRGSNSSSEDDELIDLILPESDYVIVVDPEMKALTSIGLSDELDIPITYVEDVTRISEPFVSAFR